MDASDPSDPSPATCSTTEAARRLGLAVRSVQLMVDRGELLAWKTPGGHRRIQVASIEQWLARPSGGRRAGGPSASATPAATAAPTAPASARARPLRVLLIEDSAHFQNLISLLLKRELPDAELHVAQDGITGLALTGRLEPDLLLVDILLPGIDGATLITSLRTHPQFSRSQLIVVTSLDARQREPYAFALEAVPVVHKSQLVAQLPPLLAGLKAPRG